MMDLVVLKQVKPQIFIQIADGLCKKSDIEDIFDQLIVIAEEYEKLTSVEYGEVEIKLKDNIVSFQDYKNNRSPDPPPLKAG